MCSEQIPFPRVLAMPFSQWESHRTRNHTHALRPNGKLNLFPLGKQFQSSPGPGRGVNMSNSNIQVSPTDSGVWLREIIRETLNTQSLKRLREKLADSLHDNYCIYSDATGHMARRTNIKTGRTGGGLSVRTSLHGSQNLRNEKIVSDLTLIYQKEKVWASVSMTASPSAASCVTQVSDLGCLENTSSEAVPLSLFLSCPNRAQVHLSS